MFLNDHPSSVYYDDSFHVRGLIGDVQNGHQVAVKILYLERTVDRLVTGPRRVVAPCLQTYQPGY